MFANTAMRVTVAAGTILALASCMPADQADSAPTAAAAPSLSLAATPAELRPFVQACKPWDEWDKPAPPFKVHGNTYHVGTCGISAILITGDDGHVLIDSGTEAGADVVAANIAALGFDIKDVRYLLSSHEHFDHVGGMAKLQRASDAYVVASQAAAPVLRTGQAAANDPQAGMHAPFEGMLVLITISEGESVDIDGTSLIPVATPGHSPGALSWHWQSCEGTQCLTIAYADSLSPVSRDDYLFSDHPEYLAAYFAGLERLGRVDCNILLTPHPSHSRMIKRMRAGNMIQDAPCAYYAISKARDVEDRIRKEQAATDAG